MSDLITIHRPLKEVFGYVIDHSNDKYWKPFVTESIKITPDPIGVGTRFKITTTTRGYRRSGEVEIIEYDPYHSFAYRANDKIFPFIGQLHFSEIAAGTSLHGNVEFQAQGIWKLPQPLIVLFFHSQTKRTFARLKEVMESK
jgi:hypothetical protein